MTDEKRAINQAAAAERLTRRKIISVAALSGLGLRLLGADRAAFALATDEHTGPDEHRVAEQIKQEKIGVQCWPALRP